MAQCNGFVLTLVKADGVNIPKSKAFTSTESNPNIEFIVKIRQFFQ